MIRCDAINKGSILDNGLVEDIIEFHAEVGPEPNSKAETIITFALTACEEDHPKPKPQLCPQMVRLFIVPLIREDRWQEGNCFEPLVALSHIFDRDEAYCVDVVSDHSLMAKFIHHCEHGGEEIWPQCLRILAACASLSPEVAYFLAGQGILDVVHRMM